MRISGDDGGRTSKIAFFTSPVGLALLVLLAIAGAYLWMEHRAHLLGALLWLPLLACALMHLFHHKHGHQKQAGNRPPPDSGTPS